jgi:hypothetical protein
MSLDHDLGTEIDAPVLLHSIIEAYLDGAPAYLGAKAIKIHVHSANPTGVKNLHGLWASFLRSAP